MEIIIESGSFTWTARVYNTPTGRLIQEILKTQVIKGHANRWGNEIYFSIPLKAALEPEASDVVSRGDLGYWPPGNAFCIFFGPTPVSHGNEVRAASPVNVFGSIETNLDNLAQVRNGDAVIIRKAELEQ